MWRIVPLALILLAGCASDRHEKEPEVATTVAEREGREHHGHHASGEANSDNVGQDILDDVESGFLSGLFQAIFDAIFSRDD